MLSTKGSMTMALDLLPLQIECSACRLILAPSSYTSFREIFQKDSQGIKEQNRTYAVKICTVKLNRQLDCYQVDLKGLWLTIIIIIMNYNNNYNRNNPNNDDDFDDYDYHHYYCYHRLNYTNQVNHNRG